MIIPSAVYCIFFAFQFMGMHEKSQHIKDKLGSWTVNDMILILVASYKNYVKHYT
jgi:hypothetical protein